MLAIGPATWVTTVVSGWVTVCAVTTTGEATALQGAHRAEIDRRLELQRQGSMLPFAVIEKSTNEAVGMTTFMHIDAVNRRVEIGSTWYRKRVQRSALNTECKLLLLSHAFEQLNCIAVEFRTHFFNFTSRTAIERLGAKLDGVLRSHQLLPAAHASTRGLGRNADWRSPSP